MKTNALFDILSRAAHDIWALNMRTAAAAARDFSTAAGQALAVRDPAQALDLFADFGAPATEKMLAYVIRAKDIMTSTKNSIATMADGPGDDADPVLNA
jgi:phasin family protein